jgi:hypothetical protein
MTRGIGLTLTSYINASTSMSSRGARRLQEELLASLWSSHTRPKVSHRPALAAVCGFQRGGRARSLPTQSVSRL